MTSHPKLHDIPSTILVIYDSEEDSELLLRRGSTETVAELLLGLGEGVKRTHVRWICTDIYSRIRYIPRRTCRDALEKKMSARDVTY